MRRFTSLLIVHAYLLLLMTAVGCKKEPPTGPPVPPTKAEGWFSINGEYYDIAKTERAAVPTVSFVGGSSNERIQITFRKEPTTRSYTAQSSGRFSNDDAHDGFVFFVNHGSAWYETMDDKVFAAEVYDSLGVKKLKVNGFVYRQSNPNDSVLVVGIFELRREPAQIAYYSWTINGQTFQTTNGTCSKRHLYEWFHNDAGDRRIIIALSEMPQSPTSYPEYHTLDSGYHCEFRPVMPTIDTTLKSGRYCTLPLYGQSARTVHENGEWYLVFTDYKFYYKAKTDSLPYCDPNVPRTEFKEVTFSGKFPLK